MMYNQSLRVWNFLLIFFLFCVTTLHAQTPITGIVVDAQSGEALPFVNLLVNGTPHSGTTTDMDGYFELPPTEEVAEQLNLSYVGYKDQSYNLKSLTLPLRLTLQKTSTDLGEVVVVAGENPAYRLIRLAAAHRQQHNPERIPQYACEIYHKMRMYDQHNAPTIDEQGDSLIYYTLLETVSNLIFQAPDLHKETVLATRWSGFKQPDFVTAVAEIQPLGFHRPNILILDREYFNPIGYGSIQHYEFRLEDTLYQGIDTIYTLRFFPRKHSNVDALEGALQINTNGYALQSVWARPAQRQKINMVIEQQYNFVNGQYWFPTQSNFEIEIAPRVRDTFTIQGRRYYSNIVFDTTFKNRDFGWTKVALSDLVHERDSSYWKHYRRPPITPKEKKTYEVIDEAAKRIPINAIANSINEWEDQRIQLGLVSVNYTQFFESSLYEKFRIGANLYTSYKWSPYVTVGGYVAYGFGDQAWKHGASLTMRPKPMQDIGFQISYFDDVIEPAAIVQNFHSLSKKVLPNQNFLRRNMLSQMDRVQEVEISAYARFNRHLKGRIFGNWSHRRPLYDYAYQRTPDALPSSDFTFTRVGVQLRFAYKEALIQMGSTNLSLRNRYPVVYLSYTHGIKGVLSGHFDYQKLLLGVETSFFVKGLGRTSALVQAGWIGGEAPYCMLFNGRGSFENGRAFIVGNTFQTMRPNEFVNRQFAYAFIKHDFGSLLFRTKHFQPKLRLYQAVGFGWLNDATHHIDIPAQDMRHGYFESGLVIADILRLPMFNFGYFGLGGGAFMRYGAYSLSPAVLDNIVFKMDMSISF